MSQRTECRYYSRVRSDWDKCCAYKYQQTVGAQHLADPSALAPPPRLSSSPISNRPRRPLQMLTALRSFPLFSSLLQESQGFSPNVPPVLQLSVQPDPCQLSLHESPSGLAEVSLRRSERTADAPSFFPKLSLVGTPRLPHARGICASVKGHADHSSCN